jgi:hypothetical protein
MSMRRAPKTLDPSVELMAEEEVEEPVEVLKDVGAEDPRFRTDLCKMYIHTSKMEYQNHTMLKSIIVAEI